MKGELKLYENEVEAKRKTDIDVMKTVIKEKNQEIEDKIIIINEKDGEINKIKQRKN